MTPAGNTQIGGVLMGVSHFMNWPNNTCSYYPAPEKRQCWCCGHKYPGHVFKDTRCNVCRGMAKGPYLPRRSCFNLHGSYSSLGKAMCQEPPPPPPKLRVSDEKIAAFLAELDTVCEKHGLGFTHEDSHGSFIVVNYEDDQLCTEYGLLNETGESQ